MAIDIRIDQVRANQLIAQSNSSPGKLIVLSDKTSGAENNNGTINDADFLNQANAEDTFFVVSGSKFSVRSPNTVGTNSGVALFTGDLVVSGSLIVTTDQTTNYKPILAKSSSFIGVKNLILGNDNGSNITNTGIYSSGTVTALSNSYFSSVEATDGCSISNASFSSIKNSFSGALATVTGCFIGQSVYTSIESSQLSTVESTVYGDFRNVQNYISLGDFYANVSSCYYSATIGNYNLTVESALNLYAFGTVDLYASAPNNLNFPMICLGSAGASLINASGSFIIGSTVASINSGFNGIIGGSNVSINGSPTNSLSLFGRNVTLYSNDNLVLKSDNAYFSNEATDSAAILSRKITMSGSECSAYGSHTTTFSAGISNSHTLFAKNQNITSSNVVLFGTNGHTVILPGNINASTIYGTHNFLSDGATRAFTTYSTQSGPTHINTASNGQVQFGQLTRLQLGQYISSTATSSIPEVAGAGYMNRFEHEDILGITGSYAKFRCILSTATSSTTAFVKLWNATDSGYVQIGGPGVYYLSTTSSSPTALVSSDLTNAVLGFSMSNTTYEVHIYISGSGIPAIANHHCSELLFAPSAKNGYS